MTLIEICDRFDFPFPITVKQLAAIEERKAPFEAMIQKKIERLQKYALREDSSQYMIDEGNREIETCFDMLETMWLIYDNNREEIEREHLCQLSTKLLGPPTDLEGLSESGRRKKLAAELKRVKLEVDYDGLCKKYNV